MQTLGGRASVISSLRLGFGRCPLCGPSLFAGLGMDEMLARCVRCRASPVTLSLATAVSRVCPDVGSLAVYEMSSRGPWARHLAKRAGLIVLSEFLEDVPSGETRDGVLCQDVEHLSFEDGVFDLCTSTEVFEHVADDRRGFAELCRVLKPGGFTVFTVPLADSAVTIERARRTAIGIEHLMPPEYHSDRIRGNRGVLCFRLYGRDIVDRLREAGFREAAILPPPTLPMWGHGRPVVMARK